MPLNTATPFGAVVPLTAPDAVWTTCSAMAPPSPSGPTLRRINPRPYRTPVRPSTSPLAAALLVRPTQHVQGHAVEHLEGIADALELLVVDRPEARGQPPDSQRAPPGDDLGAGLGQLDADRTPVGGVGPAARQAHSLQAGDDPGHGGRADLLGPGELRDALRPGEQHREGRQASRAHAERVVLPAQAAHEVEGDPVQPLRHCLLAALRHIVSNANYIRRYARGAVRGGRVRRQRAWRPGQGTR